MADQASRGKSKRCMRMPNRLDLQEPARRIMLLAIILIWMAEEAGALALGMKLGLIRHVKIHRNNLGWWLLRGTCDWVSYDWVS